LLHQRQGKEGEIEKRERKEDERMRIACKVYVYLLSIQDFVVTATEH
jgi:hypothetical protein